MTSEVALSDTLHDTRQIRALAASMTWRCTTHCCEQNCLVILTCVGKKVMVGQIQKKPYRPFSGTRTQSPYIHASACTRSEEALSASPQKRQSPRPRNVGSPLFARNLLSIIV